MSVLAAVTCLSAFLYPQLGFWKVISTPPADAVDPIALQHLGKWAYLTRWTNHACFYYFLCNLLVLLDIGPTRLMRDYVVIGGFAAAFGTGFFLTPAYYVLEHFKLESIRRRKRLHEEGWHEIYFGTHLSHALSLPAVVLHATIVDLEENYGNIYSLNVFVFAYVLLAVVVNRFATGKFTYPIQQDIEASKFGILGVGAFVFVLYLILRAFALLGFWINAQGGSQK